MNVEIDLSNRCSLGCQWCHFAYTHTRGPLAGKRAKPLGAVAGGDLMPLQLAMRVVDELADFGVRSITWTGGGEPTLHPDFEQIVRWADGKLEQGLYTHGGHITEQLAQILRYALTFTYVSLDAADRNSYKRYKGVDRFNDACRGVERLAEASGDCTIGIGYLVTKDNWEDIPKAAALAENLGADYIQFRPTILYDQATPGQPAEDTSWLDDAIEAIDTVTYYSDIVEADTDRFRLYRDWAGHGYHTCYWASMQSVITPNGKVWVCANKREHPAGELGDLTHDSFIDIWVRTPLINVNSDCRVMCRGHIANVELDRVMTPRPHAAFV